MTVLPEAHDILPVLMWVTISAPELPGDFLNILLGVHLVLGLGFSEPGACAWEQRVAWVLGWTCQVPFGLWVLLPALSLTLAAFSFSFQIASSLSKELCALVFGVNTFLATVLKTVITLVVSDKRGLGLPVHSQVSPSRPRCLGVSGQWHLPLCGSGTIGLLLGEGVVRRRAGRFRPVTQTGAEQEARSPKQGGKGSWMPSDL